MNRTKHYLSFWVSTVAVLLVAVSFAFNRSTSNVAYYASAKEQAISDWNRARDYTLEYIQAMPESGINFRATDSVRTFAQQMLHLTSANVGFAAQASGMQPPIEDVRGLEKNEAYYNKEALKQVVTQGYNFTIEALKSISPEDLGQTLTLFGQFELTKEQVFRKAFEHQTHHRGQTAIYLRLNNVRPPSMKLF